MVVTVVSESGAFESYINFTKSLEIRVFCENNVNWQTVISRVVFLFVDLSKFQLIIVK